MSMTNAEIIEQLRMKGINPPRNTKKNELLGMLAQAVQDKARPIPSIAKRTIFKDSVVDSYARAIGLDSDIQIMTKTNQGEKMRKLFNRKIKDPKTGLCDYLQHYLKDSVERADNQKWWESGDLDSDVSYDYAYVLQGGMIGGLLIAQKGECAVNTRGEIVSGGDWNVWTVRLICNGERGATLLGGAGMVLGLFVYALKKANVDRGMLEVADDYENYRAYCLYSRFKFKETTYPCYGFEWDLIMEVRPKWVKYEEIVEAVNNRNYRPPTSSALYCGELKDAKKDGRKAMTFDEFVNLNDTVVSAYEEAERQELGGANCVVM